MSLEQSDKAAGAVAKAPRVALAHIEAAIGGVYYCSAGYAAPQASKEHIAPLANMTLCIVVMRNGFVVIGKSAPASPENFDADLGKRFAYEDCVRQLWPLMGYSLRDQLAKSQSA